MKKLIVLSFFLIFCKVTFAQDSLYYNENSNIITFKLRNTYRGLSFFIGPRKNGFTQYSQVIWYRPNLRSIIGIDVAFKDISIGWSFRLAQNFIYNSNEDESEYSDFQLHYIGKKMIYDFYFQNFQGYYIDNSEKVLLNSFLQQQENVKQQRDDIKLKNILLNVTHIFNSDRFSYNAAFSHKEKQIKSSGSFILVSSLGYVEIKGDSSHIPSNTTINFSNEAYISSIQFNMLSIVPGYAHTFLLGKKGFQFSGSISGLTGIHFSQRISNANFGYFLKANARAYLGYHGKRWVVGISGFSDVQAFNTKKVQYTTNNLTATAFIVYKLKTNWMKGKKSFYSDKLLDKVNEQKEKLIPQNE